MILLSISRILKYACQDFFRNFWLSLITVTILVLSLFSINFLIMMGFIGEQAIGSIENKVDLSLYLDQDASEEDISILKAEISRLKSVNEIEYISKTQALENFKNKHQDDPEILESLKEVDQNPLNPSLVISANELVDYENIINSLENLSKQAIIKSRNFDDHKSLLTTINNFSDKAQQVGILVSFIFVVITVLVVFNAIRVAIFTHKKEIKIMRLVGASNWFIKTPFLAESILYAFFAVIIVMAIFYPFMHLLQPYLFNFVEADLNLINYFNSNFIYIFGGQFLLASLISIIASLIAVGKYAKV